VGLLPSCTCRQRELRVEDDFLAFRNICIKAIMRPKSEEWLE
jgi:hypothetical protein